MEEGFTQVCVWPGTWVGKHEAKIKAFEEWVYKSFGGTRVKYLEEVLTKPDKDDSGNPIEGTGGRSDLFFKVHDDDIDKFAVPRLLAGVRWWEDVLDNEWSEHLYPDEIYTKYPRRW